MMPQTRGVPAHIEKVAQNVLTLVYVGGTYLFVYPTNQDAWENLKGLVAVGDGEGDWPEEVYLVLLLIDTHIRIAQIGHITCPDGDEKLKYTELWGDDFVMFSDRVMTDWPKIKESPDVKRLLCL